MPELKVVRGTSGAMAIREGSLGQQARGATCYHTCVTCTETHDWTHPLDAGGMCARPYYEPCRKDA